MLCDDAATLLYTLEFLTEKLNFTIHLCDEVLLRTGCRALCIGRDKWICPDACGLQRVCERMQSLVESDQVRCSIVILQCSYKDTVRYSYCTFRLSWAVPGLVFVLLISNGQKVEDCFSTSTGSASLKSVQSTSRKFMYSGHPIEGYLNILLGNLQRVLVGDAGRRFLG